jgi:uncharacterized membrane protein YeaQ/YmgE (transglycosylase-associated protein family)
MRALSSASIRGLRWLSASILTAAGLWCTRGLLDIVNGPDGVTRVAMLAPWWLLVTFVVILGAVGMAAIRTGADPDVALPLCALGLLVVPYLPWLPDRVPALRAAAGPARYLLWLVVFWLLACRGIGGRPSRLKVFLSPLVIFLASTCVFGTVAWRLTDTTFFPGGDEPHYLVITQSLLHDGDLKIENNHRRDEYRAYFNRSLEPHYLARGKDGQIYSIHPVGLPVLAMPVFALGGYHAVVAMIVVMAAVAAALLWRWAREITGSMRAATFAWAAAALTAPFLFNSFTVYPEIPAALAVMVAIGWRPEATSAGMMLFRGAAIGALPWLSTKYAPMAVAVTIVMLFRTGWNRRAVVALLAPVAIALTAWFAFFFWIWGSVSPSAPYGSSEPMTLGNLAHGAPGLIFDQEYGVAWTAPILVLAFVGMAQMFRSGGSAARRALELTFIFGALLCTVGAFHLWWGGEASAGRPIASGVLLLGIPIASLFASTETRPSARAGCHVLLASSLGLAVTLLVAQGGALIHNDRDASAVLLDWASPTWPLSSALPSFIGRSLLAAIERTLAWLALGALVAWLVHLLKPREFGGAALATMVLGFIGAVALVSLANTTTTLPAELAPEGRARVPLLDRFDTERRPTTILYNPLSRITSADALSRVTLVARPGLRTAPQPIELLWNARFALPAGEYQLRLTRSGASAPNTTLALQIGRTGPPLEQWDVVGPIWEHRFALPIDAALVGFRAQPDLGNGGGELRLTPSQVVDEGKRIAHPPIVGARRYGTATAYFHDDFVFAEPSGYWTRGRARGQVTYATNADAPATIDVVVHCGPVENRVTLSAPGWEEQLAIEQGQARHVAIPTRVLPDLGVRLAPLEISVQNGFVPAEVDPVSTDRRFLGCWIEPGPTR